MSIENSDLLDEGLQSVMGKDRCQNEWGQKKIAHTKGISDGKEEPSAKDVRWEPMNQVHSDLERVKLLVLALIPYVALIAVVFWWQQSGRLDSTTGFWALIVLALMAGISIGRSFQKGE